MKIRHVAACAVVAFSAVLAVVVGNRMSAEAMAVVIGVVCGVAASIPMSAVILAMSRQHRPQVQSEPPRSGMPASPPIYLLSSSAAARPAVPWADYQAYNTPLAPAQREYRVIGDERLG